MTNSSNSERKATLGQALLPILFLVIALSVTIIWLEGDPHIPLVLATIFSAIVAIKLGFGWKKIEKGIIEGITLAMQAILILAIIGMIIGSWIQGGIVPTMIFYGLQILTPGIFLVATTIICGVVAISTGSSWTTAGTVGLAAMGIGQGLGIPVGMIAGAIISGAYFGDKLSPLSDTTNLTPAMVGDTDVFDHVRHMLWTTIPGLIIALILFGILGARFAGGEFDASQVELILSTINENFFISPILLIPPILVVAMVIFKIPPIPGLMAGSLLGAIFAMIFQGATLGGVIDALHYGFHIETGVELVDELLSGGGLDSMMWTISLILAALSFGGVMEKCGFLAVIVENILKLAQSIGSLILSTHLTAFILNLISGDQYLALVIPGRMFSDAYRERGLHGKNLSRALEASGTITSALVPWNTCGAFMWATLGIHPFVFLPYAFFNLVTPIISIIYGFTGFSIAKTDDKGMETESKTISG